MLKDLNAEIKQKESQLTALKAEIKSRQRLFNQFTDSSTDQSDTASTHLEHEIFIRDKQISILNDRLIVLDAELRAGKSDIARGKELQKQQNASEMLLKMRLELEEKISHLEQEMQVERKRWVEERESLKLGSEASGEEVEKWKAIAEQKERQVSESKLHISQLSGIIQGMSHITDQLNEKQSLLTHEIETLNKDLFQSKQASANASELERSLTDAIMGKRDLEHQLAKMSDALMKLQAENEALEGVIKQERGKIRDVQDTLEAEVRKVSILETQLRNTENAFAQQLEDVKTSLEASINDLRKVWENLKVREIEEQETRVAKAEDALRSLKLNFQAKERERVEQERLAVKAISEQVTLRTRIQELEDLLSKTQKEHIDIARKSDTRLKTIGDDLDLARKRIDQLMADISEKDITLSQTQSQSVSLLSRLEEAKSRSQAANLKISQMESSLKDAKGQLSSAAQEKLELEKCVNGKDQKIKQLTSKVKSLEEELWNKDSESLKKDSKSLQLMTQIEDLRKSLQQAHAKLRSAAADQLADMSAALNRKDAEIALLKEMVRSANIQMKSKDGELKRVKKRLEPSLDVPHIPNPAVSRKDIKTFDPVSDSKESP